MQAPRITPRQAKHDAEIADALIVCAYDSSEKFEKYHLEGAISLEELRSREDQLSKQRELVFY